MDVLLYLIPIALMLGVFGLVGFFWALRNRQFDDPEGDSQRALFAEDDRPLPPPR
jgi:cbb3-type cytochrome oxidase maturation protein